jgi:hypothetical protein
LEIYHVFYFPGAANNPSMALITYVLSQVIGQSQGGCLSGGGYWIVSVESLVTVI